jgi:hypothetical protein
MIPIPPGLALDFDLVVKKLSELQKQATSPISSKDPDADKEPVAINAAEIEIAKIIKKSKGDFTVLTAQDKDYLFHHGHDVRYLDIQDLEPASYISANSLDKLLSFLPNVQHLYARFSDVNDDNLSAIAQLKDIETIDITGYSFITDNGIRALQNCQKLKHLHLYCAVSVTNLGIASLLKCKSLQVIDLKHSQYITDLAIKALFVNEHGELRNTALTTCNGRKREDFAKFAKKINVSPRNDDEKKEK